MFQKKTKPAVFTASKVHTPRKRIIFFAEILFVTLLLVGTLLMVLGFSKAGMSQILLKSKELIDFQTQEAPSGEASFEERARQAIDKKILTIVTQQMNPDGHLTIQSAEGISVILVTSKDLNSQVRTLQTVLSKATIENRKLTLIDFRFEKLVVK